jgi:hypothetical protein
MPFKSEKQRRYLYANEPELAKKWSKKYGDKILKAKGGADAKLTKTTPPKKGPNSQVPPIKLNVGGDACCSECVDTRGTRSIQVKGFNFRGVR